MCEMVPSKLCIDNDEIFAGVLNTIHWGLTSYGSEITVLCSEFLQSVASFVIKQEHYEFYPAYNLLHKFIKVNF